MRNDGRNNYFIYQARIRAFQKLGSEAQNLKLVKAESDGNFFVEYYDSPSDTILVFYRRCRSGYRTRIVKQPKLFSI